MASNTDFVCGSACISEGGAAHSPYPVVSSIMFPILFFQPFLQKFFRFFPVSFALRVFRLFFESCFPRFFPLKEQRVHFRLIQPFQQAAGQKAVMADTLEIFLKRQIKFIVIRLSFYQEHTGKRVEGGEAAAAQPLFQRVLDREPFSWCDRDAAVSENDKKSFKHEYSPYK